MIFKTLSLILFFPILLDHRKISSREYKNKKIKKTLKTLRNLKTTYVMRKLHLYVRNKDTYMINQLY